MVVSGADTRGSVRGIGEVKRQMGPFLTPPTHHTGDFLGESNLAHSALNIL